MDNDRFSSTISSDFDPDPAPKPTSEEAMPEQELFPPAPPNTGYSPKAEVTFQGNSYDLTAVVGVTIAGAVLLACMTCNLGYYCLPFLPLLLGIIGLATAKDSVDPDRTRLLSWISVGSGAAILLLIAFVVILYIGFVMFAVASEGGGGF
jgi:hypothetical protein